MAANSGPDTHHLWKVIVVEEDGAESVAGIYDTMGEAEIAKGVLEQGGVQGSGPRVQSSGFRVQGSGG